MPNDAAEYRGYRIIWDVRQVKGTEFWRGRVAIVEPPSANERIHPLDGIYFPSRKEAIDYVVGGAKEWIDKTIKRENLRQP